MRKNVEQDEKFGLIVFFLETQILCIPLLRDKNPNLHTGQTIENETNVSLDTFLFKKKKIWQKFQFGNGIVSIKTFLYGRQWWYYPIVVVIKKSVNLYVPWEIQYFVTNFQINWWVTFKGWCCQYQPISTSWTLPKSTYHNFLSEN